ncbi:VOC family protein [Pseudonocardia kujensis]|uniref:VOC family protein n=1 Tax=Pseudonocardia kujensis TaxID=1128675 RepID=UPI001E398614|nr:VOC family protein [Pseudonocardia kujensis]MCE0764093.1 VOC family protein [Pseudonocardia kujensis]
MDHIAVWSRNLFETTYELSSQTGLGNRDGGFFPGLGLGQKVISLGGDVYIEVESIANHRMILDRSWIALEVERQTANGPCFVGWCLRTDRYEDMEHFAQIRSTRVMPEIPGGKMRMSGPTRGLANVPVFSDSWMLGLPNLYYVPDLSEHPSRLPIQPGTGAEVATGVTEIEVGGSEEELRSWLGDLIDPTSFPFEIAYNGRAHGLYAVSFGTSTCEKTIRLNSVTTVAG